MNKTIYPRKLTGNVNIPSSKSDSQRAVLCASLSKGTSIIKGVGKSEDDENMLRALKKLGVKLTLINSEKRIFEIDGTNAFRNKQEISVGESGLGARTLIPILSFFSSSYKINALGSLLFRPMNFFLECLPNLGVSVVSNGGRLPFIVKGPINDKNITVSGELSSQFISGLLMLKAIGGNDSSLYVQNLNSKSYVDMTIDTLRRFGISIDLETNTKDNLTHFRINKGTGYQPANYEVEGDWSSASCFFVAKVLGADINIKGLKQDSLQPDKKFVDYFASKSVYSDFEFSPEFRNRRMPFEFDATHCPDLFPALTILGVFQKGTSVIKGLKRLKHKESNRGEVLKQEFEKLGAEIKLRQDTMYIYGKGYLNGGTVLSHSDHRIAMCLGIAALFSKEKVTIEGSEAVSKSYPNFWSDLDNI